MAPRPPTRALLSSPPNKRTKRISKHTLLLSRITKTNPASTSVSKVSKKKRRRPSKKLVANLDSLFEALPSAGPVGGGGDDDDDDEGEGEGEGAWEGITDADTDGVVMKKQKKKQEKKKQGDKITHKTLPSRPGAGRKKEKLVAMERERFARNLAEMSGAASASVSTVAYGVAMADDGGGGGGAGGGGMVVDDDDDDDRGVMKDGSGSASASADRWAAIREFICQTMERRPEVGRKT